MGIRRTLACTGMKKKIVEEIIDVIGDAGWDINFRGPRQGLIVIYFLYVCLGNHQEHSQRST